MVKDEYRRELLEILSHRPGKGMALGSIVRMVYNSHTSLFATSLDYTTLYNHIGYYLRYHSKKKESPFKRCKKRGYYTVHRHTEYPTFI